jgi:adenine-specific DNA-methyltransferase
MPKKRILSKIKKDISLGQYQHTKNKRANNPQVGLVSSDLDTKPKKKVYQHDPYIDPTLSWAGKVEGTSFDVDTVSLHIHERIDPKRIIKQVLKKTEETHIQPSLFEQPSENFNTEKEFDFYSHTKNWSNRLIAGDSLLVMNSILEKENMASKVQMIYIDPPYGITFNSNFQPFTNKRDVKEKDDDSIPAEPEMIKAFRDTWEMGIHSYLTYLRDRMLLAKELLHESGSICVQIGEENMHRIRTIMDEIFNAKNFVSIIPFRTKTMSLGAKNIEGMLNYLIIYAKDINHFKYRQLYIEKDCEGDNLFCWFENEKGERRKLTREEISNHSLIKEKGRFFRLVSLSDMGENESTKYRFTFDGEVFAPPSKKSWLLPEITMIKAMNKNLIMKSGNSLNYIMYHDNYPISRLNNLWPDTSGASDKIYVVQTSNKVLERCILMTTDPGDLVLDITCGSGTTAFVAEQWGRRWITCDTSRVAIQLAKQRLMTAKFSYYEMAQPEEGISSGFKYKTVPHITLRSLAYDEPAREETLYDQPIIVKNKVRVTGPFTVEAVPGIRTKPIEGNLPDVSDKTNPTNLVSEKLNDYLDSIRTSGIRSYNNEGITFNSVEVAEGFAEIHAFGNIDSNGEYKKCAIVFGPDYAPMEQTQVERTLEEVRSMSEKPNMVVFCSYAFDPEASKDIDNIKISDLQILKAQMNTDLLTKDLKKKANTNRPFWLIGEPDIEIQKTKDGKYQVEVKGFDYYDPRTQELKGGSTDKIAVWMLDTDYDNRSLFPSQIFFPMQDEKRDWTKLAKALNGNVDEDLLEQYTSTVSIPFTLGKEKTIAVKIVDDRGVEMLIVKKI